MFLIGPSLGLFVLFVFVPLVTAGLLQPLNWNGFGPLSKFVGLGNYLKILNDPVFQKGVFEQPVRRGVLVGYPAAAQYRAGAAAERPDARAHCAAAAGVHALRAVRGDHGRDVAASCCSPTAGSTRCCAPWGWAGWCSCGWANRTS
ncbi:MAG: hypothetical protein QM702_10415 [Rubrivivax sp.]